MEKENINPSIKSIDKKKKKKTTNKRTTTNNPEIDEFLDYFDMLDEDDPYGLTSPFDSFMET
jgi:hypothetical protein